MFELDDDRATHLEETMRFLEEGVLIDIELLRSALGVWIWAALLRRCLLAVPHAVFDMINKNEKRVIRWWPSALKEWRRMRHLVPFMQAVLNRPVGRTIVATDAEGSNDSDFGGYGAVAAQVRSELAEEALRVGTRAGRVVAKLDGPSPNGCPGNGS